MSTALAEKYLHFDITDAEKWQHVPESPIGNRAISLWKYEKYLRYYYKVAPGEVLEFTAEEEELIANATDYIEQTTGLAVGCNVTKYTSLRNNFDGVYDLSLHQVSVRRYAAANRFADTISFGSLLVHELMHSTMADAAKLLDIQNGDDHTINSLRPHHITEITPSFNSDNFFEEGLAEEIASRWRVRFDPNLQERERDLLSSFGGRAALPVRMYNSTVTIDETSTDIERGYKYASFCSFGIQLLSEYTGVDLIELLIQARKKETQNEAAKKIKDTVESVEPGLYDVLTGADYSVEDFEDCLEIIKQAISNHAQEQNFLNESRGGGRQ